MNKICHGCFLASMSVNVLAQNYDTRLAASSLWDLPIETLMTIPVSTIASGTETPADKSASTVTVITAADMAAQGVTSLDEALSRVPGLFISYSEQGYFSKYIFRGISSTYNPEALVLVNGIPSKSLFTGNRGQSEHSLLTQDIARIEVIRGPSSALYGADAFGGVINIITKTANDIKDSKASIRGGSFNLVGGWLEQAFNVGNWQTALIVEREVVDNSGKKVESDAQTALDNLFQQAYNYPTRVSLAPGDVQTRYEHNKIHLDMLNDAWQFRLDYRRLDKGGTGPGVAQALTTSGLYGSDRLTADLNYAQDNWRPNWDLKTTLSYYHNTQIVQQQGQIFPAGAFMGAFPNGMIGEPEYREDQARFDLHLAWNGWQDHIVRMGSGFFWGDIYKVTEHKNFDAALAPLATGITDVSDTSDVFLHENQRTNSYLYAQDEWRLQPQTVLTTGLRFDDYSDFGHTVNPRLALVKAWQPNMTTRLLYGRAFHAPSFVDLYATNNPAAQGNPNLRPEILSNWEMGWSHQLSLAFNYNISLFRYTIDDQIVYVSQVAENGGGQHGYGGELDWTALLTPQLRLTGSYSHQTAHDDTTSKATGIAPENMAALRIHWQQPKQWQAFAEVQWVGRQYREPNDSRSSMNGYSTVNATWQYPQIWSRLDVMIKATNLFNADIRSPSRGPVAPFPVAFVPYDYPLAGRSIIGQLTWHW